MSSEQHEPVLLRHRTARPVVFGECGVFYNISGWRRCKEDHSINCITTKQNGIERSRSAHRHGSKVIRDLNEGSFSDLLSRQNTLLPRHHPTENQLTWDNANPAQLFPNNLDFHTSFGSGFIQIRSSDHARSSFEDCCFPRYRRATQRLFQHRRDRAPIETR